MKSSRMSIILVIWQKISTFFGAAEPWPRDIPISRIQSIAHSPITKLWPTLYAQTSLRHRAHFGSREPSASSPALRAAARKRTLWPLALKCLSILSSKTCTRPTRRPSTECATVVARATVGHDIGVPQP